MAHISLPLIGEGEVFWNGDRVPAAQALPTAGPEALALQDCKSAANASRVSRLSSTSQAYSG
ncbi:MAG: hypothetical protein CL395_06810 [Acidiferrobacteraceae bacterium]|nr:hypothetical protein [Acidiferrobacteraceae bacterium]MCP4829492.1 aromatic amino acid lyase [Pseudomonadota bacterium]